MKTLPVLLIPTLLLVACSSSSYDKAAHEWPTQRRTTMNQWIVEDYHAEAIRNGVIAQHTLYDHHFVEYEYADGTLLYAQARQIPDCTRDVSESAVGTLGRADLMQTQFTITGANPENKRLRTGRDAYQLEHDALFKAIRENLDHNEAETGANATMTAILGRMSNYAGQDVTWDDAMLSGQKLVPDGLVDFQSEAPVQPDAEGRYPVAVPGVTGPFEVWY